MILRYGIGKFYKGFTGGGSIHPQWKDCSDDVLHGLERVRVVSTCALADIQILQLFDISNHGGGSEPFDLPIIDVAIEYVYHRLRHF
jgi:hypothetical protein